VSLFARNLVKTGKMNQKQQQILVLISSAGILAAGIFAWFDGDLSAYMFPTRLFLDANHFIISAAVLIVGIWFYMNDKLTEKKIFKMNLLSSILLITIVAGVLMLVKLDFISVLTGLAYTVYDFSLVAILILNIFYLDKIFNTKASEK
jgi:Na+/pantothenate symporter